MSYETPWRSYADVMNWKMAVIPQMTNLDAYLWEQILYLDYNFIEGSSESMSALLDQNLLHIYGVSRLQWIELRGMKFINQVKISLIQCGK